MKKLFLFIAVLTLCIATTAQAQNRRPVRRSVPSTKTVQKQTPQKFSAKKSVVDEERKRLNDEIDSLEALHDDLLGRYEKVKDNVTKTDENGNEYQIASAIRNGQSLDIYLRVRNQKKSLTLKINPVGYTETTYVELDNDKNKKYYLKSSLLPYIEKGFWQIIKIHSLYGIKLLPKPKKITKLEFNEIKSSKRITFTDIEIIDNE